MDFGAVVRFRCLVDKRLLIMAVDAENKFICGSVKGKASDS